MKLRIIVIGISLMLCPLVQATTNYTVASYPISKLIFFSSSDPQAPNWSGYVRLVLSQPVVWAASSPCEATSVAVRPDDKHIFAAAQAALASERSVQLFIDEAQIMNGICTLRALQY